MSFFLFGFRLPVYFYVRLFYYLLVGFGGYCVSGPIHSLDIVTVPPFEPGLPFKLSLDFDVLMGQILIAHDNLVEKALFVLGLLDYLIDIGESRSLAGFPVPHLDFF